MNIKHEKKHVYFVWNKNGHKPTVAHVRREAAIHEAERLAQLCPGQKFLVMRVFAKISAKVAANDEGPTAPASIAA